MNPAAQKSRLMAELQASGVDDERVLAAMDRVPREIFVPEPLRHQAYENHALPIGHGQTVSQPQVVGMMTQALAVGDRMKVLEIGTGSGYQAAVLSYLCRRLYTKERHGELLSGAEDRFRQLNIRNITTLGGDGSKGWPEQAPFDRIIVTAAAHDVPPVLVDQLAEDGVMVVPVGLGDHDEDKRLVRVHRTSEDIETEDLGQARFVPFIEGAP